MKHEHPMGRTEAEPIPLYDKVVLHVACQRVAGASKDSEHIYHCYQCNQSFFEGKQMQKALTEGPGHVVCPLAQEQK